MQTHFSKSASVVLSRQEIDGVATRLTRQRAVAAPRYALGGCIGPITCGYANLCRLDNRWLTG